MIDTTDIDLAISRLMKWGAAGQPVRVFAFQIAHVIQLPLPPSANRYWRRAGNHLYRSGEADGYIELVRSELYAVGWRDPGKGDYILIADVFQARGDLGNREKVLSDALQGALYEDDKQIVQIHLVQHKVKTTAQRVLLSIVAQKEISE